MRIRPASLFVLGVSILALAACGPDRGDRGNSGGGGGGGGGGANPGNGGGEGTVDRPDEGQFVEQQAQQELTGGKEDIQSVYTDGNRAGLQVGFQGLNADTTITVMARPLGDFTNTDTIIDGVYDFLPHDLELPRSVTIFLPLNNALVTKPEQVELVRWASPGVGWEIQEAVLVITPGDPPTMQAAVAQLGIYGLRIIGGWDSLTESDVVDVPDDPEVNCPGSRSEFEIGGKLGQRFPDPNLRNGEGKGESLYNLCGNKAILIVSSAFWCGSCRAEFAQLLTLAPSWKETGGAIYYTMFENDARQPPTDAELLAWEADATPEGGERLFRVLKDPNIIPSLYRGEYGALPFNAVLNGQMVVTWYQQGAGLAQVIAEMTKNMEADE
jgi:hypothetical protein